jgi:hypothetical protein
LKDAPSFDVMFSKFQKQFDFPTSKWDFLSREQKAHRLSGFAKIFLFST